MCSGDPGRVVEQEEIVARPIDPWLAIRPLAGFVMLAFLASAAGPAAAQQPAGLRITGNLVSGSLMQQPVKTALEALGGGRDFTVELPAGLADHRVSLRLEAVPLATAIDRLLRPFDYLVTFRADGRPSTLRVLGLRRAWSPPSAEARAAGATPGGELQLDPDEVVGLDGLSPREQRARDEAAAMARTPPVPEALRGIPVIDDDGQVIDAARELELDPEEVVGTDGLTPRERRAREGPAAVALTPPGSKPDDPVWNEDGQLVNDGIEILLDPDEMVGEDGLTPRERRERGVAVHGL